MLNIRNALSITAKRTYFKTVNQLAWRQLRRTLTHQITSKATQTKPHNNVRAYSHSMGTKPIARLMRASWRHGFQGDQDCPRCSVTRTRFALSDIYSLRAGSKWWLARKWPLTCGDAARMLAPDYRHPCIPAKWRKFTPREYEKE